MQRIWQMRNAYKIVLDALNGRENLQDLDVDEKKKLRLV